jgi:hypothetical protein
MLYIFGGCVLEQDTVRINKNWILICWNCLSPGSCELVSHWLFERETEWSSEPMTCNNGSSICHWWAETSTWMEHLSIWHHRRVVKGQGHIKDHSIAFSSMFIPLWPARCRGKQWIQNWSRTDYDQTRFCPLSSKFGRATYTIFKALFETFVFLVRTSISSRPSNILAIISEVHVWGRNLRYYFQESMWRTLGAMVLTWIYF